MSVTRRAGQGGQSRSVRVRVLLRRLLETGEGRLGKPRTRSSWWTWADDVYNVRMQAAIDDEWRAQAAGEEPNLTFLPVGDPATHGVGETGAEPKGLTGAARRRRGSGRSAVRRDGEPAGRGVQRR